MVVLNHIPSSILPPLFGLIFFLLWKYSRGKPKSLPLPPGPRPLPVVGNIFDLPKELHCVGYRDLSRKYGDVMHLRVLGKSMIILGSAEAASELLDKRSSNYSSRGQSVMTSLAGWEWNIALMPYGARWREHRRILHQYFNRGVVSNYNSVQLHEARRFLRNMLKNPGDFVRHIRFGFGAVLLKIGYGIDPSDTDDFYIEIADKATKGFGEAMTPGAFLVEFFPLLQYIPSWFPGASFQRKAALWYAAAMDLKKVPFDESKKDFNSGVTAVNPSIANKLLEKSSQLDHDAGAKVEELARNMLGIAYGAGADTTYAVMQWMLMAMVLHPDVQKRAQIELDMVVGQERLPDFSDRNSLPYANAVAMECLRWKSALPLGIPHCASADDEYKGYFIPKGSLVIPNIWAISQDAEMYPEPQRFNPERFLKDGKLNPEVKDPGTIIFGFGRRICPGRYLADESLFINVASVLHALYVSPPLDATGKPVNVKPDMITGLLAFPAPYRFSVKPRWPGAEALILAEVDSKRVV